MAGLAEASDSLATTGAGVPAGTTIPLHAATSKSFCSCSATVGTSGSDGLRRGEVIASALSFPALTYGSTEGSGSIISGICPPLGRSLLLASLVGYVIEFNARASWNSSMAK